MFSTAQKKYQQTSMQTASPSQLLLMLYDGAIRFVKAGIAAIEEKNIEKTNMFFGKAQAIIHELIASLNFNYQISNQLYQVYEYMIHRLIHANIHKDLGAASEILNQLVELRDTWDLASKSLTTKGEY
ncbi:flagellar export chaperone FliS [Paenibacillus sp. PDC88]|uniref:flagellar export chaperone FliS n=1 Tax=Paenibacillus sp. PDC88 TaxID=1884375 RepID=UPI000894B384|nr:flagellar export chaperone FliS [Paenibacillus sp. PDC88]SDW83699.1 flagellar protein FliS [Paenibacillus sp. PDC88]